MSNAKLNLTFTHINQYGQVHVHTAANCTGKLLQ